MRALLKTRIAARSTALIVAAAFLVGLPVLALFAARVRAKESARQQATLTQLLDTVERTAQIACFVGDTRLAEELALGLLKNEIVGQVTITTGDRALTQQTRSGWSTSLAPTVSREIHSPFDAAQVVGRVTLSPNDAEISRQTARQGRSIALLLAFQGLLIAAATVCVVLLLVTRPITRLSKRLHGLQAEAGESLPFPEGHESDEIGRLVGDVNSLIDRLLAFIHAERFLKEEMKYEHQRLMEAKEQLERSLTEVKTLQGLLPICAWCKKVRDDEGLWTQIEQYVTENTDARFTHGLCPECAKEQLAEHRRQKEDSSS